MPGMSGGSFTSPPSAFPVDLFDLGRFKQFILGRFNQFILGRCEQFIPRRLREFILGRLKQFIEERSVRRASFRLPLKRNAPSGHP